MNNTYKPLYRVLSSLLLVAIFVALFAFIWYNKLNVMLDKNFLLKGNYVIITVYAIIVMFSISMFGGFKIGISKKSNIIISQALGLFIANCIDIVITVLVAGYLSYIPRIMMYYAQLLLIQILTAAVVSNSIISLFYKVFPPLRLLHIYRRHDNDIADKFASRTDKYKIAGEISFDEDLDKISSEIDKYDAVLINDIPNKTRNLILKICFSKGKRAYFTPKISDIIVRGSENLDIFDTVLLFTKNSTMGLSQRIIKRISDIFISLIGIIITSPIMIITALAIFLYDRGPVFYKQTRYTIHGNKFKILKFRSMNTDAEKDGKARLATENDSRITPVGRFIRACRIDELPQFFNILKGDMSIVGPRPERPEIADEYTKEVPEFSYRLQVKAGLTGYAQVFGKYNTTSYDKLKLDMVYVENCSILLDIKLILLTLKVILLKESTEGIEKGQTTASNKK
ncbi:MAG: exopolysaccharide biosynthesis polyprenyl glycosylphosphotransferase [Candidatus Limimorpha sp.]